MKVEWTESAKADLLGIRAYIAAFNPGAANRVGDAIFEACNGLAHWPRRARLGRIRGTRELVLTRYPYIAVFRIKDDIVEILNVHHGARQWPPQP